MTSRDPFEIAHAYGIDVLITDFGEGAAGVRVAEYEPCGPIIRLNARVLAQGGHGDPLALARHAVAHELYHHRERIGDIARLPSPALRERAADDFARVLLAGEHGR